MNAKMMTRITDPDLASLVSMWEDSEWRVSRVVVLDEDESLIDDYDDEPDWEAIRDATDEYREARYA